MGRRIEEVMTKHVHCVPEHTTLREVARRMRDENIGDVLVTDGAGKLRGIVTDRDLVVRAIAEGRDVDELVARDVCSDRVVTLDRTATVEEAVSLMRDKAIRRVPVVDGDKPVGIVSIGDLAIEQDPRSALADISAAAPNN